MSGFRLSVHGHGLTFTFISHHKHLHGSTPIPQKRLVCPPRSLCGWAYACLLFINKTLVPRSRAYTRLPKGLCCPLSEFDNIY